jgi:hypothetical protein
MGDIADMYMEDEIYNGTFDGDMNPGYLVAAGGWCVPADQAPEPFTFPRIQRGGIKYPKPKGNAMARTRQQEIAAVNKEIEGLVAKRDRLQREQTRRRSWPAPPRTQSRWSITVKFDTGKEYEFLVVRPESGGYFTTGTKDGHFPTWAGFLKWLDEEVVSHSGLHPLALAHGSVALPAKEGI